MLDDFFGYSDDLNIGSFSFHQLNVLRPIVRPNIGSPRPRPSLPPPLPLPPPEPSLPAPALDVDADDLGVDVASDAAAANDDVFGCLGGD